MDYGFGKTYSLPGKFTALNGTIQYYKVTASVDLVVADEATASVKEKAEAQANYLRVLEILRTYGGQPVITKAEGKVIEFTLEQANVYGKGGLHAEIHGLNQVSAKVARGLTSEAVEKITEMFKGIKPVKLKVDAEGKILGEDATAEASAADLFASAEVKEAF